jgi:HAD superfamily hydrolase (TIGR01509 family)
VSLDVVRERGEKERLARFRVQPQDPLGGMQEVVAVVIGLDPGECFRPKREELLAVRPVDALEDWERGRPAQYGSSVSPASSAGVGSSSSGGSTSAGSTTRGSSGWGSFTSRDISTFATIAPLVKAVVFDLDGTLVDTGSIVPTAYAATIAALGGPTVDSPAVVAAYPLGPTKAILEHFLARDVSADEVETYYTHLASVGPIEPYGGVAAALRALRKRVPLAVYTGAGVEASRIVLGRAGLASLFDTVVGGDEVGQPKPDPEGLLLAARRLGVAVKATAYVGDAQRDVEAAHACGALAVAAGWGHELADGEGADIVMREPHELAQLR